MALTMVVTEQGVRRFSMNILFLGDIIGKPGRDAVAAELPGLRSRLKLDLVIANGENAAGGFGLTRAIAEEFFAIGHRCDLHRQSLGRPEGNPHLHRRGRPHPAPAELSQGHAGQGANLYQTPAGSVLVINVMGRVFMDALDDPFAAVDARAQLPVRWAKAPTPSWWTCMPRRHREKMAMGHFCDGRASLVVGTHQHVPTADAQILPGGTAYQSDAGACADYDSVIGMDKAEPVQRFLRKMAEPALFPRHGAGDPLCGVFVQTGAKGLASRIEPVRVGGRLKPALPELLAGKVPDAGAVETGGTACQCSRHAEMGRS